MIRVYEDLNLGELFWDFFQIVWFFLYWILGLFLGLRDFFGDFVTFFGIIFRILGLFRIFFRFFGFICIEFCDFFSDFGIFWRDFEIFFRTYEIFWGCTKIC